MRASELILDLKKAIDKYGDLEVFSECDWEIVDGVLEDDDYPTINKKTKERMIVIV